MPYAHSQFTSLDGTLDGGGFSEENTDLVTDKAESLNRVLCGTLVCAVYVVWGSHGVESRK